MALTKIDLEMIGEMIDERQSKNVLPLINRILDMMATKEDLEELRAETKEGFESLDKKLSAEAAENYLSLKADIDEVIGMLGVNVQSLDKRVQRLEEVVGVG